VLIVYEAIRRLLQPPTVNGRLVLVVALAGIVVNLFATWQLSRAERKSLNIQGSFQHILTDLYAFIATAAAALVIIATGYTRADPLVSFLIAALMLRASYGLLRDAGRVLMEAAPAGMSAAEVGDCLARHPQVVNVHDFHLWEITSGMPALSAHVLVRPGADCHAIRRQLEQLLDERYEIEHTTLQVDHAGEVRPIQVRRLGEEEHPERSSDQG
jgi:cobalt-zinc-cadmium efflux system protein